MNTLLRIPYITLLLFTVLITSAHAEDSNLGKGTATKEDFINKLTDSPSDENTVDTHQSKSRGLLCASRGLGGNCSQSDKPVKHEPSRPPKIKSKPSSSAKPTIDPRSECSEKGISMEIAFDYKSDSLSDAAIEQLRPLGEALASEQLRGSIYRIEGHTDAVGGDAYNKELSRRRAEVVKNYLTQEFSFTGKSMKVIGKGESDLADPANPSSEKNRRVRIVKVDC